MTGIGRGRDWLKLKTESKPGEPINSLSNKLSNSILDSESQNANKYDSIVAEYYLVNENDDDYQLKLRAECIQNAFEKECKTLDEMW